MPQNTFDALSIKHFGFKPLHYSDITVSQIIDHTAVYSTAFYVQQQMEHQGSALLGLSQWNSLVIPLSKYQ